MGYNQGINNSMYGKHHSEETKQKIKNKYKERINNGWKSPLKGKSFSEETKLKMSLNHADVFGKNNPMYGKKRPDISQWNKKYKYKNGIGHYRERALKNLGSKCKRCGIKDIRVLLVHHKDRNRNNNQIKNFEVLCRNCHILEHYEEIFKKAKHGGLPKMARNMYSNGRKCVKHCQANDLG